MLGRRKKKAAVHRVFFTTDIHGSDRCFRKFLAAAKAYSAQTLILGGDVAGKAIVPLLQVREDEFEYTNADQETVRFSSPELEETKDRIAFSGMYPYVCGAEEHDRLASDEAFRAERFNDLISAQIRAWRALADERLDPSVRCLVTPGNDDPLEIDAVLDEPGRFESPELEVTGVGPVLLASLGNTNRTPWDTDREFEEDELTAQIDAMLEAYDGSAPLMFNFHCPPFESGLDTVIMLDDELRPRVERGGVVEGPVGSTAVREAIGKYGPVVALHGHIHEAAGVTTIGDSLCINPGSSYNSGWLQGAIIDFDEDGRCVSHLLTNG